MDAWEVKDGWGDHWTWSFMCWLIHYVLESSRDVVIFFAIGLMPRCRMLSLAFIMETILTWHALSFPEEV